MKLAISTLRKFPSTVRGSYKKELKYRINVNPGYVEPVWKNDFHWLLILGLTNGSAARSLEFGLISGDLTCR